MYEEICEKIDDYLYDMRWEDAFEKARNAVLAMYEEAIMEAAEQILEDFDKGEIYEEHNRRM